MQICARFPIVSEHRTNEALGFQDDEFRPRTLLTARCDNRKSDEVNNCKDGGVVYDLVVVVGWREWTQHLGGRARLVSAVAGYHHRTPAYPRRVSASYRNDQARQSQICARQLWMITHMFK